MAVQKKVDVVTIGAGWNAAIMAWRLTEAGLRVVSLEQGPSRWTNPDFEMDHDQLRYHYRHLMMVDLARETWTWRPNPQSPALPMRRYGAFNPGQGVGGSAVHWSAEWWRYLETDFKYRTHHIERYGKAKLPEGSRVRDWPISYGDLERYYNQTDIDMGASGQAGNLNGKKLPGGNPFEAPRSQPYPNPPLSMNRLGDAYARACTEMGYHVFPQPSAITSRAYTDRFGNHRSGCLYCGFCTRFGCEVDAKASAQSTYLPVALRTGRYEIRTNSKVIRVNLGAGGYATGVTYVDQHGQEQEQPADMVLLTGYTLSNVRMMLLSRDQRHTQGIGNNRGLVGTNATYQHWQTPAIGLFEGQRFNLYTGNTSAANVIYEWNGDNFDHSNLDFIGGGLLMCGLGELDPLNSAMSLPIGTSSGTPTGYSPMGEPTWGAQFKERVKQWDSVAAITVEAESLPYDDQYFDLDPHYVDAHGLPLLRFTFDWHANDDNMYRFLAQKCKQIVEHMGPTRMYFQANESPFEIRTYQSTHLTGGAIMGTNPGNSVTNKFGQVWDTPNVFVTGAALFPQNPGANPTGTITPVTYMTADAILGDYLKHPGRIIA
jgi:gluconate 2-dehydrogenase alpha chain